MSTTRLFRRFAWAIVVLAALSLTQVEQVCGQDTMPNSSKECAICHIRWVDAFGRTEAQESSMDAIVERQAGSGDMCLSCHDGSVVDSRFKVWSTQHHTTDSAPSPAVKIPTDIFPLDAEGRMTCATCHTAHAMAQSSDIRTVVFLRQPNVDSSLCLSCHGDHAVKSDCQHLLGHSDSPIPQVILDAGGKTSEDGHSVICQTCHEPHGASNAWMLVLPPSKLCIACHTEKASEVAPAAGAPVHHIGYTYEGFKPPASLVGLKATFGAQGELSCLSCHRLHDASGARPLLIRKNEDSSLCLECHKKEKAMLGSRHDLSISSPDTVNANGQKASESGPCGVCHRIHGWARDVPETDRPHSSGCMECHKTGGPGSRNRPYMEAHPVGIALPEGMASELPLDIATGKVGCLTCHDPHSPRSTDVDASGVSNDHIVNVGPAKGSESQIAEPRSFLRREGSKLCISCHANEGESLHGPHDPVEFAPALREALGLHPSVGSCRVCHSTHSAKGPYLWTRSPATGGGGGIADLCGACHGSGALNGPDRTNHRAVSAPTGRGMQDVKKGGMPSDAGETGCISCHNPHSSLRLRGEGQSLCTECHQDKAGVRGSVHDPQTSEWAKMPGFVSKGFCVDCHPVHGVKDTGGVWGALGGGGASEKLCEGCHRLAGPGKAVDTPHLGKSIGEEVEAIGCSSCHDIHQKEQGAMLLKSARADSGLCVECHPQAETVIGTLHDLRESAPQARNSRGEVAGQSGACGACHLVHSGSQGIWSHGSTVEGDSGESLCTCCHSEGECGEDRVPVHTDHPEVAIFNRTSPGDRDYMPTFDSAGEVSRQGGISCFTCHQPHGSGPSDGKGVAAFGTGRMFLRLAKYKRVCVDCHGIETLWRYLYYHKDRRNPHPGRDVDVFGPEPVRK